MDGEIPSNIIPNYQAFFGICVILDIEQESAQNEQELSLVHLVEQRHGVQSGVNC